MSVLSCNVRSCPNIMCSRLHPTLGYICNNCFERLVSLGVGTNLGIFFDTPPKETNQEAAHAYFNKLMPAK